MHSLSGNCHISWIGSILNPLAGKFSEDTQKKGKVTKTGASHDWWSLLFVAIWLAKGSQMTKVVWLSNETDYSYCEFVVPNTPYWPPRDLAFHSDIEQVLNFFSGFCFSNLQFLYIYNISKFWMFLVLRVLCIFFNICKLWHDFVSEIISGLLFLHIWVRDFLHAAFQLLGSISIWICQRLQVSPPRFNPGVSCVSPQSRDVPTGTRHEEVRSQLWHPVPDCDRTLATYAE